jgi:hypothetical protein
LGRPALFKRAIAAGLGQEEVVAMIKVLHASPAETLAPDALQTGMRVASCPRRVSRPNDAGDPTGHPTAVALDRSPPACQATIGRLAAIMDALDRGDANHR